MMYFNVQSVSRRLKNMWRGDVVLRLSLVQLILWSCFFYAFSAAIPIISYQTGWAVENLFLALTVEFLLWAVLMTLIAGMATFVAYPTLIFLEP